MSAYINAPSKTPCPWTLFYVNALTLLDTLYDETCTPQTKITRFIDAAKCCFTKGKKAKKQVKQVAIDRQSCKPAASSCKNRSPTPHPHTRSRAETREPCQPTSTSSRARSPTPHPQVHSNVNARTFLQSITIPLHKDDHSFYISTIQLHQTSLHSTENSSLHIENSSLQDHFRTIYQKTVS